MTVISKTWPPNSREIQRALEEHYAVMDDDEFLELLKKLGRIFFDEDQKMEAFYFKVKGRRFHIERGQVDRGITH